MPRSLAFLQRRAAASITPGFEVFVHEVMAAITTDPCFSVCYSPLKVNFVLSCSWPASRPNPLKPVAFVRELFQSFFS